MLSWLRACGGRRSRSLRALLLTPTVAVLVALATTVIGRARADTRALPWLEGGADDLALARSVRVLLADQPVLSEPWSGAPRRGSAARDVHLPIFAAKRGPGCATVWIEVGPFAWLCHDAVEASETPPVDADPQIGPPLARLRNSAPVLFRRAVWLRRVWPNRRGGYRRASC